jgi:hypothetical protein
MQIRISEVITIANNPDFGALKKQIRSRHIGARSAANRGTEIRTLSVPVAAPHARRKETLDTPPLVRVLHSTPLKTNHL